MLKTITITLSPEEQDEIWELALAQRDNADEIGGMPLGRYRSYETALGHTYLGLCGEFAFYKELANRGYATPDDYEMITKAITERVDECDFKLPTGELIDIKTRTVYNDPITNRPAPLVLSASYWAISERAALGYNPIDYYVLVKYHEQAHRPQDHSVTLEIVGYAYETELEVTMKGDFVHKLQLQEHLLGNIEDVFDRYKSVYGEMD